MRMRRVACGTAMGLQYSGYTSVFAAGTQRYGVSNSLTINGRVEIQASNQTFGVGADFSLLQLRSSQCCRSLQP